MDIVELGVSLLSEKLNLQVDPATVRGALSSLLGDGSGNIDLAGLAAKMAQSGELGSLVNSWLGDGANAAISPDAIRGLFGDGAVGQFASRVGVDSDRAAQGLAETLPQMVDSASSGGNLLESLGSAGGLLGAAKSLLG